jgi:hypothetical protein
MTMAREIVYRPGRPPRADGKPSGADANDNRYWRVCQDADVLFAYNSAYFYGIEDVVADVVRRFEKGEQPESGICEVTVWRSGHLLAFMRENPTILGPQGRYQIDRFGPPDVVQADPLPGQSGYEEWAMQQNIMRLPIIRDEEHEIEDEGEGNDRPACLAAR